MNDVGFFGNFLGDWLFYLLDDLWLRDLAGRGVLEEDDDHD